MFRLPVGMSTLLEQMGGGLPTLNPMALAAALTNGGTPMTPNSAANLFGQITATSPQKVCFSPQETRSFSFDILNKIWKDL